MTSSKEYGPGLQYVSTDTPLEDIYYLIKRDGGVAIRNLITPEILDETYEDIKDRINDDAEWEGAFFPKETKRAPSLIARSPLYTKTQVMNPIFQAVCSHFLTTRSTFWWGDNLKESVSKPQITSCVAIEIGPGGKAQPLHRDSYIHHRKVPEIDEWDDERDKERDPTVGMFVAGCKVTRANGGTQLIPGSHLWATVPDKPPNPADAIVPELEKGDGLIMLASLFHGGGNNTTTDQYRLVYSTFATRGYLRQEENQYLAVPKEIARQYDRATLEFIGYYISEPAGGWVEELDPYYALYPEKLKDAKMTDF
ncbi:phytanoyl-CoA dioxygenase family protein [Aspergillus undulatus]|uniref:phytanoyl-CoA dioxygenase family protein n=1 Tax=Aspergillus undulatus TaxID=1810928 RepID=UPI003CCD4EC3